MGFKGKLIDKVRQIVVVLLKRCYMFQYSPSEQNIYIKKSIFAVFSDKNLKYEQTK